MSEHEFIRPRLTGKRFEGKAIPLEFLKDLAVLEEMIIEVAKSEFLKDHPDRKRTPRGFTDGIELRLKDIEDGSAIPVISLVLSSMTLLPPANQTYFEKARDAIISAVDAAEREGKITDHLPGKLLGYFNQIGRGLREGEAIEFSTPNRSATAKLTRETRRRLVYASTSTQEIAEEITIRGMIPEADQDNMRFQLQLADHKKVMAPIAPQHRDTILDVFNDYEAGQKVLIQGIGIENSSGKLVKIESIEHINLLDDLDVGARLDELRLLKDGWLEGGVKAPSTEGIDWLETVFDRHYPDEMPLPHLYPTPEGGISAEWSNDQWDLSLDIHLADKRGTWHELNLENDRDETRELDLEDDSAWAWLIEKLKETLGKAS